MPYSASGTFPSKARGGASYRERVPGDIRERIDLQWDKVLASLLAGLVPHLPQLVLMTAVVGVIASPSPGRGPRLFRQRHRSETSQSIAAIADQDWSRLPRGSPRAGW